MSKRCHSDESEALSVFKAAFNDSGGYLTSWVNETDCCTMWLGISCNNQTNRVVSVEVGHYYIQDIQGVISDSLCQLHFLTSLSIHGVIGATTLPHCLGSLPYIDTLDLSWNGLSGVIPSFVCLLTRLTYLDLSFNNLNGSIPSCLGNLSSLAELRLGYNHLNGIIPASVCNISPLESLDLRDNKLNGSIPSCLGNLSSLTDVMLNRNQLGGSIPASLGSISSLKYLYLFANLLSGRIPASLGSLSSLRELDIADNQLSSNIPHSLGNLSLLEFMDISRNQLTGTIPTSFSQLSSLILFHGAANPFNDTILSSSFPTSIESLDLPLNHQPISETFFYNLTKVKKLSLSSCVLNTKTTWIPSFQLIEISLVSCMIDCEIPDWISTQFSLEIMELVNVGLVGEIPSWLWETIPKLQYLNLSENHLEGNLYSNTTVWMQLVTLDVSRNELSGHMPSIWSPNIRHLLLNNNLFNGKIPPSLERLSQLELLNLANNFFIGEIPLSLSKCSSLRILNLGNNSLRGSLPHEFSELSELYSLVVHSNNLTGTFPPSIANCSKLQVLDIGNNLFEGEIPALVGNISSLRVLVMKNNKFKGNIPSEIGQLLNLQILLLSSNKISGSIPHTITLLQGMTIESQDGFVLHTSGLYLGTLYQDGLDMTSKGIDQHYPYILSTLTCIDLSNNELEGEVASNFGNLRGLRLLNLSMNNLNGTIPKSFGEMIQLESLDLSRNRFSGQIPAELEYLSYLGSFNLSNNNLSGSIPQGRHITGTFGESSYSGNPNLWGCPLPKNCSLPEFIPPPPSVSINNETQSSKYLLYKIAVALSYGAAFGGIILLILIKMSWRKKYFSKVDTILKKLFPWMKNLTL